MRNFERALRTIGLISLLLPAACSNFVSPSGAKLMIGPPYSFGLALGREVRLSAVIDDANGPVQGAHVSWSSSTKSLVVDSVGTVSAVAAGSGYVRGSAIVNGITVADSVRISVSVN